MGKSEKDIIDIGFAEMGHWFSSKTYNSEIDYHVKDSKEKILIYAFTSENEVKYIGKTEITLDKRMYDYRSVANKKHEGDMVKRIKKQLKEGEGVKIFMLPFPPDSDISLNEKEKSLTKKFDPPWNKQNRPPSTAGITSGDVS